MHTSPRRAALTALTTITALAGTPCAATAAAPGGTPSMRGSAGLSSPPPHALAAAQAAAARREAAKRTTSGEPVTTVIPIQFTVVIPPESPWNSSVRTGERCPFALRVEADTVLTIRDFRDREWHELRIRDRYTNVATGLSFVDTADYVIHVDKATLAAVHTGTFWRIDVPGAGIEVLDVGQFTQTWSGPFPWPVYDLRGARHDVNSVPFGTRSYCDWASGVFP